MKVTTQKQFSKYWYKMRKEVLKIGDIEIQKLRFHFSEKPMNTDDVIDKWQVWFGKKL